MDRRLVEELATGRYLYDGRNLVLLGPPGVGKTHLATALGVLCAELGHRVYFTTAIDVARKLAVALDVQSRREVVLGAKMCQNRRTYGTSITRVRPHDGGSASGDPI